MKGVENGSKTTYRIAYIHGNRCGESLPRCWMQGSGVLLPKLPYGCYLGATLSAYLACRIIGSCHGQDAYT